MHRLLRKAREINIVGLYPQPGHSGGPDDNFLNFVAWICGYTYLSHKKGARHDLAGHFSVAVFAQPISEATFSCL